MHRAWPFRKLHKEKINPVHRTAGKFPGKKCNTSALNVANVQVTMYEILILQGFFFHSPLHL